MGNHEKDHEVATMDDGNVSRTGLQVGLYRYFNHNWLIKHTATSKELIDKEPSCSEMVALVLLQLGILWLKWTIRNEQNNYT